MAFSQTLALNTPCTCCTSPPPPPWVRGGRCPRRRSLHLKLAGLLPPVEAQRRGGGPATEPPLCWAREKEPRLGLEKQRPAFGVGRKTFVVGKTTEPAKLSNLFERIRRMALLLKGTTVQKTIFVPRVAVKEVWFCFIQVDVHGRQRRFLRSAPFSSSARIAESARLASNSRSGGSLQIRHC